MTRKKRHHPAPSRRASGSARNSNDRRLMAMDQGPIRRRVISECSREMSRLEKVRAEWRHFEREDQPAYLRWSAETFGAVLTELRTNQALLLEKRELIEQVEFELYASGSQNYRAAYARVIKRRSQPWDERDDEHPPQDGAVPGSTAEYFESLHESEQKFIFEEFLRTVLGLNPKRLSKKEYQRMFTEFRDELADQEGKSPPRSGTGFSADADETGAPRRGHQRAHQSGRPDPSDPPPPPPPQNQNQSRIKELYRLLVRRLHPDLRADSETEVSALWHEVQDAYSSENLERLETLLALTDIEAQTLSEQTSVFQIRAALTELRRAYQALQRSLKAARNHPAWDFARGANREKLRVRLQREFQTDLSAQRGLLREMTDLIASWEPPRRKARRR